jgi:formate dehydrogenase subunit beta
MEVEKEKESQIQESARQLLAENAVDLIIGYGKGTLPNRVTPVFIRKPEDAHMLVWNDRCEHNLVGYLNRSHSSGKIGIVVKGCDARSLVGLIKEKQITRDRLVIIGVVCNGILDTRTVGETPVLYPSCQYCEVRIPPLYDILIGSPDDIKARETSDLDRELAEFEALPPEERWKVLEQELQRCIRCYACRNACPLCYCEECFVDKTQPKWISEGLHPSDIVIYHLVRALHSAGRCGECGACERACPMGIKLRLLTKKISRDVAELFQDKPGIDLEQPPSLYTFSADDDNSAFM